MTTSKHDCALKIDVGVTVPPITRVLLFWTYSSQDLGAIQERCRSELHRNHTWLRQTSTPTLYKLWTFGSKHARKVLTPTSLDVESPRMAKRALITGITGQDGSYLAELLLAQGYEVFGVVRRLSAPNGWRIDQLRDPAPPSPAHWLDQLSVIRFLDKHQTVESYNLAGLSFVPASCDTRLLKGKFTAQRVTYVLHA